MTYTAESCAECKSSLIQHWLRSASKNGHRARLPDKERWAQICRECHEANARTQAEVARIDAELAAEYEWRCDCGFSMPLTYAEIPSYRDCIWRLCPLDGWLMFRMQVDANGRLIAPDDDGKARELDRQARFDGEHNHASHRSQFTGQSPN